MPARAAGGKGLPATYQTRISGFAGMDRTAGDKYLSAYAERYCSVQRKLFADAAAGRSAVSLKQVYLRRYRIPARMFNGVRVSLEGKVASVREQQLLRRDALRRRIVRAQGQIANAGEELRRDWLHQKQRRLGILKGKLERLESGHTGRPHQALLRVQEAVAAAAQPGGQRLLQPRGMVEGLAQCPR